LTSDRIVSFAECAGLAKKATFVRVAFFEESRGGLGYPKNLDQDYELWARSREYHRGDRFNAGQIQCIRGNCVLRFADVNQRVETRVLSGTNPLILDVDGLRLELLDAHVRPGYVDLGFAFARTNAPLNVDNSKKLYAAVSRWLPFPLYCFYLRNDPWFIQTDFPDPYPFAPQEKELTKEEFEQTVTMACTTQKGAAICVPLQGN
jgi:hypothetical protein